MGSKKERDKLPAIVKLSFFISSYFPLFLIIIIRQIGQNLDFMYFAGFNLPAIKTLFIKYGVSIFFILISIFGLFGLYMFITKMKKLLKNNGDEFKVESIQNKNTESIGYIATYLLPLVFQTYSTFFDILQVVLLLLVMYIIYTHSNLIVVNPLLSLRYSLYDIGYCNIKSPEVIKNGIFIVNCHYLERGDILFSKKLTNTNLFYGIIEEEKL